MTTISVHYGAGKHQDELSYSEVVNAVRWQWILFYVYVIASGFSKLAIIAFLLEFERNITSRRKYLLYAIGAVIIVTNYSTSALQWMQCKPVTKTWDNNVLGVCDGRERNTKGGYVQGSVGAITDAMLSIYPMVVFWQLQMDLKVRLGVCALFLTGLVCSACAVLKTVAISNLSSSDTTYDLALMDIYSLTELWVTLMVSCVPVIKQVVTRLIKGQSLSRREEVSAANPSKLGYVNQHDDASKPHSDVYNLGRLDRYRAGVTAKEAFSSEESILHQEQGLHGITVSKTVRVNSDKMSDNLGDESA